MPSRVSALALFVATAMVAWLSTARADEPSRVEKERAARALLDPLSPIDRQSEALALLRDEPLDGGSALAPIVAAAQEPTERGHRARDVLYALLGRAEGSTAFRVGPLGPGQSFAAAARRKFVDPISGFTAIDHARALVDSPRGEFRELARAMIARMVAADALAAAAEDQRPDLRTRVSALLMPARERRAVDAALDVVARAQAAAAPREESARAVAARAQAAANAVAYEADVLIFATAVRQYDPETLKLSLARWDAPAPALRRAVRAYWDSMVTNGELHAHAAEPLADLVIQSTGATLDRILAHLQQASPTARPFVAIRLSVALAERESSYAATTAATALKAMKLDDTPIARAAARVAASDLGPPQREAAAAWLATVARDPDGAADALVGCFNNVADGAHAEIARIAMTDPARYKPGAALLKLLASGHGPHGDAVALMAKAIDDLDVALLPLIAKGGADRDTALNLIEVTDHRSAAIRAALRPALFDDEPHTRRRAMRIIDTAEARRIVLGVDLLRDLRDPRPEVRSRAAHQAESLELDAPAVMLALVRATDTRDMPVREGLVLALERAAARSAAPGTSAATVLASADDEPDPARRAYLRAARRAVGK